MAEEFFGAKVRRLLKEKGINMAEFEADTCMSRRFMYKGCAPKQMNKSTIMALAYYLNMEAEELVEGTDAMESWLR